MAKARSTQPTKPKALRAQHPRLIGFSEDENTILEAAAFRDGRPTNVCVREVSLAWARRRLLAAGGAL